MAKATHNGHCQVCGAKQKLPSGKLSKHGYTVDYGFFNGVCPGAHHAPYEESCELVKQSIGWAEEAVVKAEAHAAEVRTLDDSHVWVEERTRVQWGSTKVKLRFVEVLRVEFGNVYYMGEDGKERRENTYTRDGQTPPQYVNELYAKKIDRKVAGGLRDYIKTQQARVDAWKPAELEEVQA